MKWLTLVLGLTICTAGASAEETVLEVSWLEFQAEGRLTSGEVLPADGSVAFEQLKITNPESAPLTAEVLTIQNPGVTASRYAITGQVSHQDVEGQGCLEMWSFFPGGGSSFSRTLGQFGPMKHLEGSSDWRLFTLPFSISEGTQRPEKLLVNVVLPGGGTVRLGPLRLVQYAEGEDPLAAPGQWWSDRTGGLIGGLLGALLGCLGGLIGVLCSLGRARAFATGALKAMIVLGGASFIAGIVALARSQPYAVWFPLILLGILCSALPPGLLSTVRRRFEVLELRKMQALDVR